jgi:hypothetical protein
MNSWQSAQPNATSHYAIFKVGGIVPNTPADFWDPAYAATREVTSAKNITSTDVKVPITGGRVDASVGAYPGNTAQTGDAFLRLGAPAGASVSADVLAIGNKTTNLPVDPADQSLIIAATNAIVALIGAPAVTLAADIAALVSPVSGIAAIGTNVGLIKTKTDQLTYQNSLLNVGLVRINGVQVAGAGTLLDPWRGA